jgi:hypothetical protein
MLKDKLYMKLLFKKEQVYNKGNFISLLKMHLEIREGFLSSGSLLNVVDKVALGQVFSEYFGFLCQFSFRLLHIHHISSGAGTVGQLVGDLQSRLTLTIPHPPSKKTKRHDKFSQTTIIFISMAFE